MPPPAPRNEVHVINRHNGHVQSADCWCEPLGYWHTNMHGVLMFIVEHKDGGIHTHRRSVSAFRSAHPDATTKLLDSIYFFEHER